MKIIRKQIFFFFEERSVTTIMKREGKALAHCLMSSSHMLTTLLT